MPRTLYNHLQGSDYMKNTDIGLVLLSSPGKCEQGKLEKGEINPGKLTHRQCHPILSQIEGHIQIIFIYQFLTFAVASMFSGSISNRRIPISCTAPPNSEKRGRCLNIHFLYKMWNLTKPSIVSTSIHMSKIRISGKQYSL